MKRSLLLTCLFVALSVFFVSPAFAEDPSGDAEVQSVEAEEEKTLIIGTSSSKPFTMKTRDGRLTGFDIDLWNNLADGLNITNYKFECMPFAELLPKLEAGEIDVAIAGITIREDREKRIDFSYPYYDSGLGILVRDTGGFDVKAFLGMVWETVRPIVFLIGAFVILASIGLWWAERDDDSGIPNAPVDGIFTAFYLVNVIMTTVGFGDVTPKTWKGKLLVIPVMWSGITLAGAVFTAIAAVVFADIDSHDITSPSDLHDQVVATVAGSTSVDALRQYGAVVIELPELEDAISKLESEEVDAVVFDQPSLQYYAMNDGAGVVEVAATFRDEKYGIAFPQGSDMVEDINLELLESMDDGEFEKIYNHYFGSIDG